MERSETVAVGEAGSPPAAEALTAAAARRRRWGAVSWRASLLLFFVPVALLAATALLGPAPVPAPAAAPTAVPTAPPVAIVVTDRFTGEPLAGVAVGVGGGTLVSDAAGRVEVAVTAGEGAVALSLRREGYEATVVPLAADGGTPRSLALRPTTLAGRIADARTGAPIAGARVAVVAADGSAAAPARTGADGSYALGDIPAGAHLRVESPDHAAVEEPVGERTRLDLALTPTTVSGVVRDGGGEPVPGARVAAADGSVGAVAGEDGAFRLAGAAGVAELVVTAPGFGERRLAVPADLRADVSLERFAVKAIYANLETLVDPARVERLIAIADRTEINALVIDVKQDTVYYDTAVPFFRDIPGMVNPVYDPRELLATLDAHGLYTIARMVVFKDPIVATARPELAIQDAEQGGPWRDNKGGAWVDPFEPEPWAANAALAVELAELGFDEIQLDYVRFPADGNLAALDYGWPATEADRTAAIAGFLTETEAALAPTGAALAADVFGFVLLLDELGVGQNLGEIGARVDVVCPMVYPSHWPEGSLDVPGHPNGFPGETVRLSLEKGAAKLGGDAGRLRPWLQDFSWPGLMEYGTAELRAQIDAAEEAGAAGWMVWDPTNEYHEAAFKPAA